MYKPRHRKEIQKTLFKKSRLKNRTKFLSKKTIAFIIGFGIVGVTAFYLSFAAEPASQSRPWFSSSYSNIHSITYYDTSKDTGAAIYLGTPQFNIDFNKDLSDIRAAGFNTVRLIPQWRFFDPDPFNANPRYNQQGFDNLKEALKIARNHNMRVLLPFNYVSDVSNGWNPKGILNDQWLTDPKQYAAFQQYGIKFLTQIQDYSNITFPMLLAEPTSKNPPAIYTTQWDQESAIGHAALVRRTLGAFPDQIPAELRAKFKFGWHDGWWMIANKTLTEINPDPSISLLKAITPIPSASTYDFLSTTNYDTYSPDKYTQDWNKIMTHVNVQVNNYRKLYPEKPLIFGEFGATACDSYIAEGGNTVPLGGSEDTQAALYTSFISYAIANNLGFNIWDWRARAGDCNGPGGNDVRKGYSIVSNSTRQPRKAVAAIQAMLAYKPWPIVGDVNSDENVDARDLSTLLINYDRSGSVGDINHDGKIDVLDLSLLLQHYGRETKK